MENIFKEQIGHQPCVATVAIWKRMNRNQTVMETDSYLIRQFLAQLYPQSCIIT